MVSTEIAVVLQSLHEIHITGVLTMAPTTKVHITGEREDAGEMFAVKKV